MTYFPGARGALGAGESPGYPVYMRVLALLVLFAMPAHANRFARVPVKATPFVPAFLGSMSLSLQQQEFYASHLLNAFHHQVSAIETLPNPESVVTALQTGIEDGKPMLQRAKELGQGHVPAKRAAAILAANALSRPDQFQEVVTGLEELKPGLGLQVSKSLQDSGSTPGAQPGLVKILRQVGSKIKPQITNGIYNSRGELERLFDGAN